VELRDESGAVAPLTLLGRKSIQIYVGYPFCLVDPYLPNSDLICVYTKSIQFKKKQYTYIFLKLYAFILLTSTLVHQVLFIWYDDVESNAVLFECKLSNICICL